MDYMDPDVRCPKKAVKLAHSLAVASLGIVMVVIMTTYSSVSGVKVFTMTTFGIVC